MVWSDTVKNWQVAKQSRWELRPSIMIRAPLISLGSPFIHHRPARRSIAGCIARAICQVSWAISGITLLFEFLSYKKYVYFLATYNSVLHADGTIRLLLCRRKVHCKSTWNFTPWFSNRTALGASPVQLQVLVRTNKPCRLVLRLDGKVSCVQVLF